MCIIYYEAAFFFYCKLWNRWFFENVEVSKLKFEWLCLWVLKMYILKIIVLYYKKLYIVGVIFNLVHTDYIQTIFTKY